MYMYKTNVRCKDYKQLLLTLSFTLTTQNELQ